MMKGLLVVAASLCAAMASANAQVLNTDYYDFEGRAFIEDNPVTSTCAADGFTFGNSYTVVYRFNTGTNVVYDALSFVTDHSVYRVEATASPYSLKGSPVPTRWDYISSRAGLGTNIASSSSLAISSGSGAVIGSGTGNAVINGSLNDFLGSVGCTVSIHAALARRPN